MRRNEKDELGWGGGGGGGGGGVLPIEHKAQQLGMHFVMLGIS